MNVLRTWAASNRGEEIQEGLINDLRQEIGVKGMAFILIALAFLARVRPGQAPSFTGGKLFTRFNRLVRGKVGLDTTILEPIISSYYTATRPQLHHTEACYIDELLQSTIVPEVTKPEEIWKVYWTARRSHNHGGACLTLDEHIRLANLIPLEP